MITRRGFLGAVAATGVAAGLGETLSGCTAATGAARDPKTVRLWGVGGAQRAAQAKIIEEFTKLHPDIKVIVNTVPTRSDGDATSIITAVRGGTAPDLWYMDRFTGAQYASLGLLEPVTALIQQGEDADFLDQWLKFAVNELTYQGEIYGLPMGTGTRVLYYNKQIAKAAGIDLDELDPANGPITTARIDELNQAVNQRDARGNYTRIGLIPWDAQGWAYTWALANKAVFFDDASCSINMTAEPILKAYQYLYDQARKLDYPRVDAFKSTYEPPNHPPSQTAFLSGRQAFQINETTTAASIRKYAPKLDFGYTDLPVFEDGQPKYTWSGGFSLVAPKGSSLSPAVWEFMKFFCGKQGQSIFVPATGVVPTQHDVIGSDDPKIRQMSFFLNQLNYSTSRPPFPIGQIWWDAMSQAQDSVTLGSRTAQEALQQAQDRLGSQMKTYCPFKMPEGFGTVA